MNTAAAGGSNGNLSPRRHLQRFEAGEPGERVTSDVLDLIVADVSETGNVTASDFKPHSIFRPETKTQSQGKPEF